MLGRKLFSGLFLIVVFQVILSQNAFAYLDPGTGSYVYQVLVAAIIGGLFTIKTFWRKIMNFFEKILSNKQAS